MKRLMLMSVGVLSLAACVVSPSAKGRPCSNNACDTGFTCVANECVVQGPAGVAGPVGPPGPAGLGFRASFDFEEGSGAITRDGVGANLTGGLVGPGVRWVTSGHGVGSSLGFDGTTGVVIVEDAPTLNPAEQITISAWIRPDTLQAGDRVILSKEGQFILLQRGAQVLLSLMTVTSESVIGGALNVSAWNEIRGVYDGRVLQLFVNGQLVGSSVLVAGRIAASGKPLTLGGLVNGSSSYVGQIDEIRLLGYAQPPLRRAAQVIFTADPRSQCANPPSTVHLVQNLDVPSDGAQVSFTARMASYATGSRVLLLKLDGKFLQDEPATTQTLDLAMHHFSWGGTLTPGRHQFSIESNQAVASGCNDHLGNMTSVLHPL